MPNHQDHGVRYHPLSDWFEGDPNEVPEVQCPFVRREQVTAATMPYRAEREGDAAHRFKHCTKDRGHDGEHGG